MLNLEYFIYEQVVCRKESMFLKDIEMYSEELMQRIRGKSILVIGGAGSIGSSFIKAILPFHPVSLVEWILMKTHWQN